jgi:hypothetical protein
LKIILQQRGYEVTHNKKILKIPCDKSYTGMYQDKVKELIKVHENENENDNTFFINCKLPNGELVRIKKRFRSSINKDNVRNEMEIIRNDLITEHYIMGVNAGGIEEREEQLPGSKLEPKPKQESPAQEPEPKTKPTTLNF